MPPKSGKEAKAHNKVKAEKVKQSVADKTFGLKNKNKSKHVQNQISQMEKNAQQAAARRGIKIDDGQPGSKKAKKEAEAAAAKELNDLFAVAIKQPKVPAGVDPKSIVCEYYRQGKCTKGFKCKYSHDLSVERKGGKIDLFTDQRGADGEGEEGMEDWDQEQLEKVIKDKHGNEKPSNATTIICKYFLDAVEKKQYGWFWQCPNGKECKYRHALPPGYILKSQMKELLEEEKANMPSIEEQIEEERAKVDARTPVTEQTFEEWHSKKANSTLRKAEEAAEARRRKGILTGREIFAEEGFVAEDDLGASDNYKRENDMDAAFAAERARADAANAALRAAEAAAAGGPAAPPTSTAAAAEQSPVTGGAGPSGGTGGAAPQISKDDEALFLDDDDDEEILDDEDEDVDLDELESDLKAKAAID